MKRRIKLVTIGACFFFLLALPGSPAAKAGLKEGDIILEIEGIELTETNDVVSMLRDYKVGKSITLKVWKKATGKTVDVKVTLAEMKP